MQQVEIDGVRVLWQEAPGPLTACLIFRVGRRDETFLTGGITHLVEHLAMAALPRTHLDRNASVSIGATTFTATGRPEQVAEFLGRVCTALHDLPIERLGTEVSVLQAEGGHVDHPAVEALLGRRYGPRGIGLAGFDEPAIADLTATQVRAHAARWFVRGNAVLTLTGPPPEGLRLPLPEGVAPDRVTPTPLPLPLPCWSDHPVEGVALSLLGPDDEAFAVGLRVLRNRLEDDLRHRRGLVYSVETVGGLVGEGTVHASVWLDPKPADVRAVARDTVAAVRALAAEGPTAAELEHDLEGFLEEAADPRTVVDLLGSAAADLLSGRPIRSVDDLLAEHRSITADRVAAVLGAALPSLYLLVPDEPPLAGLPETGLAREPDCLVPPVSGRTVKRRMLGSAPRGARLTLADEGITVEFDGRALTARFADLVAVARYPDGYLDLVDATGATVPLAADDWKDGDEVLALVRRQARPELWFDAPSPPED